jgi:hypothetical protein
MLRLVYLATLPVLQLVLIVELAPPLALALRAHALAGLAPSGWPAMLQLFAMGLGVAGTALTLVFPGIVLARHRRAGATRFLGLPRWAIGLGIAGVAVFGAATLALVAASTLPAETRVAVLLVARPAETGGLALATAGVLCAELLRRSVPAPGREPAPIDGPHRGDVSAGASHVRVAFRRTEPTREIGMTSRNYWIGVVSKDHVDVGVAGAFAQVNHGKASPLERMHAGDGFAFYSPRTQYPNGEPLQAFTAIGRIRDGKVYQATMGDFHPFRLDVDFFPAQTAPVRPLIDDLSFIRSKKHWGAAFRFGVLRVPEADFALIAAAMGRSFADDFPSLAASASAPAHRAADPVANDSSPNTRAST